LFELVISNLVS